MSKRRRIEQRADLSGASLIVDRIPTAEIEAYCRLMGIADARMRGDLMFFVDKMDDVFVELAPKRLSPPPSPPK